MESRTVSLTDLTLDLPSSQRKDFGDLTPLKASLERTGLIQPLVVTEDLVIIVGRRRYLAMQELGWTSCEVRIRSEQENNALVELDENIRRKDLTWKEFANAVAGIHSALGSTSMSETAGYLGTTLTEVSVCVGLAQALAEDDPLISSCDSFNTARNHLVRRREREAASEKDKLASMLSGGSMTAPAPVAELDLDREPEPAHDNVDHFDLGEALPAMGFKEVATPSSPIICADFNEWAQAYSGPLINFLHCDFPYGINVEKFHKARAGLGDYVDSEDVYWQLLDTLAEFMPHISESAHMMFWYSPKWRAETRELLETMGWTVHERDLIWHRSDNSGILPDPTRGPRWVYETCFFCVRGDRKIVQAVANCVSLPQEREPIHKSEKPLEVLGHFFRMFIDSTTVMLDPTCGSGSALRAAWHLKPGHMTGLELDPEFAARASEAYLRQREMFKKGTGYDK